MSETEFQYSESYQQELESDQKDLCNRTRDSESDQQELEILCCVKTRNRNNVCVRSPTLNCTTLCSLITLGIIVSLVLVETILLESGWHICRKIYSNDYDLTSGLGKNVILSTAPLLRCRDNNFLYFSLYLNLMSTGIIFSFVMLCCIITVIIGVMYRIVKSINHELNKNINDDNPMLET